MKKPWLILFLLPFFLQAVCCKDLEDVEAWNAGQFSTLKVNGMDISLNAPADSFDFYRNTNRTSIYGMTRPVSTTAFALSFEGKQQSGTYPASDFSVYANGKQYSPASTPVTIKITAYGGVGEDVVGTYSGDAIDASTSATVSVSGSFRVRHR